MPSFSVSDNNRGRKLVGVAEVATRLELTAERVRQLSRSGNMPEPIGWLGRRAVWDWRDVEAWAQQEGRLAADTAVSRQVAQPWRQRPRGAMRLVRDELLQWGSRDVDVCHVRVWAPAAGGPDAEVVLLGELEDPGPSLSNSIEFAATAAAARLLGPRWREAQFYQYRPAALLDDMDSLSRVTFTIRNLSPKQRLPNRARGDERRIGAALTAPRWRDTVIEELEHLTGDVPAIWASGTYTRALVGRSLADTTGALEVAWDPGRARALSLLAHELSTATIEGADAPRLGNAVRAVLSDAATRAVRRVLAEAAKDAANVATEDVATQPQGAVVTLRVPQLEDEHKLFRLADSKPADPRQVWDALSALRGALVNQTLDPAHGMPIGPMSRYEAKLLVPGLRGGWVPLSWAESGVNERIDERNGWGHRIALPSDLLDPTQPGSTGIDPEPDELFVLLLDTLAISLGNSWDVWQSHDVPAFTPSARLSADGPLAREFLNALQWRSRTSGDNERLRRFPDAGAITHVALDADGHLVGAPARRDWFACEYPVSGPRDPGLVSATVRADKFASSAATPVFLVGPDAMRLLPAAASRYYGNTYAWGYGGGGPTNLAHALVDLLYRAAPDGTLDEDQANTLAHDLAAGPRNPNWEVSDLLTRLGMPVPR